MRTTDNNGGKALSEIGIEDKDISELSCIANQSLIDLQKSNPDLLVFPQSLGQYRDDVEKTPIFSLYEEKLTTYNSMGFVGRNDSQLTICSRFAKDDGNDYFLHYMLQKVFSINLLKFDQTPDKENIWDFYLYLFPHFLKKAYSQGLYKAYKKEEYNDANIKGTIDVKKHILKNIPFAGKIAYTTREHSYNNDLTQLIRHTIEHIKNHPFGFGILTSDSDVRDIVSKFSFVTQNSYNKNSRQKIINVNLKSISHPYFTEYRMLQKICLQILKRDKLTFGKEKDKVYGLVFDGAWLWEEYLNTVLKDKGFIHAENKTKTHGISIFKEDNYKKWYPDFYSISKEVVLDAKYKKMNENGINNDDLRQIVSYMFILQSNLGGFIYPLMEEEKIEEVEKTLNGYGGKIKTYGVRIPQNESNFRGFIEKMKENEKILQNTP
jgi:5-methylcytosine-specific restriction enzyme subunit McrC